MAEHLSEEEQLEALKRWWKENGKYTVAAVAVVAAGFFGWNQYQKHEATKAEQASLMYEEFLAATSELEGQDEVSEQSLDAIRSLAEGLVEHDTDSLYANYAQLYLAKLDVQQKDYEGAEQRLSAVMGQGSGDAIQELARLRLARVQMAAGDAQAALSTLGADVSSAYASAYAELRGDIYLAQEDYEKAQAEYQTALNAITDARSMRRGLVQMKLENASVAGEDVALAPVPENLEPTEKKADETAEDA